MQTSGPRAHTDLLFPEGTIDMCIAYPRRMASLRVFLLSLSSAAALQPALCLTARHAHCQAPAISCSAVDRRSAVRTLLGCGVLAVAPAASLAYDAIPSVSADFEALEKARAAAAVKDKVKTKELQKKLAVMDTVKTPQEFVSAADDVSRDARVSHRVTHGPRAEHRQPACAACGRLRCG